MKEYAQRQTARVKPYNPAVTGKTPVPNIPNSVMADMLETLPGKEMNLGEAMRQRMQERFGVRLSGLKVYEDEGLGEMGQRGYARGREIHLAKGEFDWDSESGRELLYHEAGHVVQQGMGLARGSGILENPALESQADNVSASPMNFSMPTGAMGPIQGWNPFENMRQSHRNALDQMVKAKQHEPGERSVWDHMTDKEKSAYKRKNPLAWLNYKYFGGKKDAEERIEERKAIPIARAAAAARRQAKANNNAAPAGNTTAAGTPAQPASTPAQPVNDPAPESRYDKGKDLREYVNTGTDILGASLGLGNISNPGVDVTGGLLGAAGGVMGVYDAVNDIREAKEQGDKAGQREAFWSVVEGGADVVSGVSTVVPAWAQAAPFGDIVSGGAKAIKGGHEFAHGNIQRKGMEDAKSKFGQLQTPANATDKDRKRRKKLSGAAEMGRRNARIKMAGGGFDMASGTLKAVGGGLDLGGAAVPASAVKLGATAVDLTGKVVTDRMEKSMRKDILENEGIVTEAEIAEYIRQHPGASKNHAKRMVMIEKGYYSGSRSEAYNRLAGKRAGLMADTAKSGTDDDEKAITTEMLSSMGLEAVNGEYNKEAIAKKLGGGDHLNKTDLDTRYNKEHGGADLIVRAKQKKKDEDRRNAAAQTQAGGGASPAQATPAARPGAFKRFLKYVGLS